MGGSNPTMPETPSAEEKALMAYQLDLLKKQQGMAEAYEPLLLATSGYKKQYTPITQQAFWDEAAAKKAYEQFYSQNYGVGVENFPTYEQWLAPRKDMFNTQKQIGGDVQYVPLSAEEQNALLTPEQIKEKQLTSEYQDLQLKAMKGEMPISPALEEEIANRRATMENTLSQKLGPNWQTTTPGIQAMKAFDEAASLTREEARRGQVVQGAGILNNQTITQYNPTKLGWYNTIMGQGYNQLQQVPGLLQPYQYQSGLQSQWSMADAQNSSQRQAAGIGAGAMAAMAIGTAV